MTLGAKAYVRLTRAFIGQLVTTRQHLGSYIAHDSFLEKEAQRAFLLIQGFGARFQVTLAYSFLIRRDQSSAPKQLAQMLLLFPALRM